MFLFIIVAIIAFCFYQKVKRSTKLEQQRLHAFWQEERMADNVRKQDISKLNYISIPHTKLPFDTNALEPVKSYQDTIVSLENEKILNLTGYTNTDLKKMYGPANLPDLTQYDTNYTKLVTAVSRWGKHCYEQGNILAAKTILEYGVAIGTDVSFNYTILAQIYLNEGNNTKIKELQEQANTLRSLTKTVILNQLQDILAKSHS